MSRTVPLPPVVYPIIIMLMFTSKSLNIIFLRLNLKVHCREMVCLRSWYHPSVVLDPSPTVKSKLCTCEVSRMLFMCLSPFLCRMEASLWNGSSFSFVFFFAKYVAMMSIVLLRSCSTPLAAHSLHNICSDAEWRCFRDTRRLVPVYFLW